MPYVIRNHQNEIIALLPQSAVGSEEFLATEHPDIVNFLHPENHQNTHRALADSDKDIARIAEDLIYLLISKNIILFTELPQTVQKKLLNRERLRDSLPGTIESILDSGESL